MNNATLFPYIVSGIITLLIMAIGTLTYFLIKKNAGTNDYKEQLQELLSDDLEVTTTKKGIVGKWSNYWGRLFKEAGIARYNDDDNTAGRDVFFVSIIFAIVLTLISQNAILGIGGTAVLLVIIVFALQSRNSKKADEINSQLPGFIFALKSQVQASTTNERAMLKVIDSMPSPLYDDLVIVKNRLLASSTFKEALEELSLRTTSSELKFLAACMIQAADSGANLEKQLVSIQKVLEDRRKVSYEIKQAVSAAAPAIWVSTIAIPVIFFASYFMDANAREFWFVEPISYVVVGAAVILYIAGMWLTKRQVDAIKNI